MKIKKPVSKIIKPSTKICPVCKNPSYSQHGVHPQCAMVQSENDRKRKLAAEQKALAQLSEEATVPSEPAP